MHAFHAVRSESAYYHLLDGGETEPQGMGRGEFRLTSNALGQEAHIARPIHGQVGKPATAQEGKEVAVSHLLQLQHEGGKEGSTTFVVTRKFSINFLSVKSS